MTNDVPELSPALREQLLEAIAATVQARFFDPKFNGRNWQTLVQLAGEGILQATNPADFESRVQNLLEQLAVQQVGFFSSQSCQGSRTPCASGHALSTRRRMGV
jgi:hypothetical protein